MTSTEGSRCESGDLGEEYNPFADPQLHDPYPVWKAARERQPVFYSTVLNAWVVTRYEDVVAVLRDPGVFAQVADVSAVGTMCPEAARILAEVPAPENTMVVQTNPPMHGKLRRYLQPAFLPPRVSPMEPELRRLAHALVDEFEDRGSGDFYQDYAYRYPLYTVCSLLAIPPEHHEQIKEWASQRVRMRHTPLSPEEQIAVAREWQEYFLFTMELVAQRRAAPGADLLSSIIKDNDRSDDPLTDVQLACQAKSLLTAGHETTALWLTITLHHLLEEPSRWRALVEDPSSAGMLVEELLRINGPVQAIWRRAKGSTEIGGVQIPAGAKLSLVLGSANVDEQVFTEPESFLVERPDASQHVTFGRGIHTCVGANLARLEGRVSLEVLATRLPGLRLAPDDGFAFKPNASTRMAQRLLVEW